MNKRLIYTILIFTFSFIKISSQYLPKSFSSEQEKQANKWVESTYKKLSLDEKIGQLFIVALYTNQGEEHIAKVRNLVENEKIGGIILMQDDARREIELINEFQKKLEINLLVGMDAEWGLFQRIKAAHKFPWALTLGAIQDNQLIYEMSSTIAADLKLMGVYWDFAPAVDVNTNPSNPIIGNRSFGSDVKNVTEKALVYSKGLQDNGVLAAIKHFPGHGDTSVDSHMDLPVINHDLDRLTKVELAPFKTLMDKNIGGVMISHLYVPALEKEKGIAATVSYSVITELLKNKFGYKGLVITDALNMNAVAKRYSPGELDLKAFVAGNDIMLFSQDVPSGKKLIKQAYEKGQITEKRLEESVKKILKNKYLLGILEDKPLDPTDIEKKLNNESHWELSERLYSNAVTLLKDEKKLLPLQSNQKYYYVPLEEASYDVFMQELNKNGNIQLVQKKNINSIPANANVIVGLHKDNSTAYKPYKISSESKTIINQLCAKSPNVILNVFGSPYALRDMEIKNVSTVLVSYENNEYSMKAAAKAYLGKSKIQGRLPVSVNKDLNFNDGIDLEIKK